MRERVPCRGRVSSIEVAGPWSTRPDGVYEGPSSQDKGLDRRKSVKTPGPARGARRRCANVRPAFPPANRAPIRRGVTTNLPVFSTIVERCCGFEMAVASPEHEAREAWAHVLDRAREELPETTVVMWFADVRPVRVHHDAITLAVPSPLVRDRLQHNHLQLISRAAQEAAGRPLAVDLAVDEALREHSSIDGLDTTPADDVGETTPASYAAIGAPAARVVVADPGRPGAPVPGIHLRCLRARAEQPVRPRRGDGRRRGVAVDGLQPVVHLRRRGPGQDPPADRGGPSHVSARAGAAGEVRLVGAVRDRVHQGGARTTGR